MRCSLCQFLLVTDFFYLFICISLTHEPLNFRVDVFYHHASTCALQRFCQCEPCSQCEQWIQTLSSAFTRAWVVFLHNACIYRSISLASAMICSVHKEVYLFIQEIIIKKHRYMYLYSKWSRILANYLLLTTSSGRLCSKSSYLKQKKIKLKKLY